MRTMIWLPVLLAACTTRIKFDDILVDAEVGDVNPGDAGHPGGDDVDGDADTDADADSDTDADADTDAPSIRGAGGTCFTEDSVEFSVIVDGVMSAARLYQEETGNAGNPLWSENHPFDNSNGNNDIFYLILDDGSTLSDPLNDWHPGTSTVFTCRDFFELDGVMTYAVQVDDVAGNPADCIVWGHDPEAMIEGTLDMVNEPEFDLTQCRVVTP